MLSALVLPLLFCYCNKLFGLTSGICFPKVCSGCQKKNTQLPKRLFPFSTTRRRYLTDCSFWTLCAIWLILGPVCLLGVLRYSLMSLPLGLFTFPNIFKLILSTWGPSMLSLEMRIHPPRCHPQTTSAKHLQATPLFVREDPMLSWHNKILPIMKGLTSYCSPFPLHTCLTLCLCAF